MKEYLRLSGVAFFAALICQMGSTSPSSAEPVHHPAPHHKYADKVVQIASFEKFARGEYDGITSVAQAKRVADFGIGTFTGLDGEMIMLNGVMYHAPSSGHLHVAAPNELIPFATLTRFRAEEFAMSAAPLADYPALQAFL